MKAVILAAGTSSRLRPLTDTTPKCLLPVAGVSILDRTIGNVLGNDILDFVIVTGYRAPQIHEALAGRFPDARFEFFHNEVYATTNNIYSLWLAKEALRGHGMLLLDSDIVFDRRVITALLESGRENCLAVNTRIELGHEEIKTRVDAENRIREIGKEVPPGVAIGESIGIELFSPCCTEELFETIDRMIVAEKKVNVFYEAAFQQLIDAGTAMHAVDVGMYKSIEIDTIEDLRAAELDVAPYIIP
jgi:choline kinase